MAMSLLSNAVMGTVLPASDIDRAHDFYENKLGLDVGPSPLPDSFFVHGVKGSDALVYKTDAHPGDATEMSFLVEDLDAVAAELRGRGVQFMDIDMDPIHTVDGIADMGPGGKTAWLKDTEGNTLNIAQM
jgi:catechol 2,3-dioxygenase-like lactoylglutathione lyase family enzyme